MKDFFKKKENVILMLILVLAACLRLFFLTVPDGYTDEVLLGVRAIGMIDYDSSDLQTTPWQWVDAVPGWMHLSFHDHPILFFLLQNFTIKLFGENMFALRLPSALLGIIAVFLIYLVAEKLLNKKAALLAAALLAVQSYHIWVSRLGIQDGLVITLSLLIWWLWLKAVEKKDWRWWCIWGAVLGLGVIAKYTILIIVPILLFHALIYKHYFWKDKLFWYGVLCFFVASSPSWMYNLLLYRDFGHFDFQISALLGQYVEKWQFRQGRIMVGSLSNKIKFFFEVFIQANSILFNSAIIISLISTVFIFFKKRSKILYFLSAAVVLEALWFTVIGSTFRFVVMIIPYLSLLIAFIFSEIIALEKYKKIIYGVLAIFIIGEMLFSVNTFLLLRPWGKQNIAYAQINTETQNFGFNQINDYLDNELKNKVSGAFGKPEYQFMADLHNKAIKVAKEKNYESYPIIVIYDKNFNFLSTLWTFQRRLMYYGWPMMSDKAFFDITGDKWEEYYQKQGIKHFIYFTGVENLDFGVQSIYAPYKLKQEVTNLEKHLEEKGIKPEYIKNKKGTEAFKVYKF